MSQLSLRGKFMVPDPARAGELTLSLTYRGGAVVYLNGKEIARGHLPAGELKPETMAEEYPPEAFVKADGKPIRLGWGDPQKNKDRVEKRLRRLERVVVDPKLLVRGVNVLAVELRRAPYYGPGLAMESLNSATTWNTCGLVDLELRASGDVEPGSARPAVTQVWNHPAWQNLPPTAFGDPCESLKPVRLAGARNGAFSGQVVVSSPNPIRGLKAVIGDLKTAKGDASIPSSAVLVRYPLPYRMQEDFHGSVSAAFVYFQGLEESAPAEVAVCEQEGAKAAVQPVWVTVQVPPDAKPGNYRGELVLRAEGLAETRVPVELSVADWKLVEPPDFTGFVDIVESPRSVALQYSVPEWSDKHWALIDRSFAQMAKVGAKAVYITVLPDTYFGNGEGMIRFEKGADGAYKPDFSIVDKYLDVAVKHLGKPPVVCIYLWDRRTSTTRYTGEARPSDKGVPITILDPATGNLSRGEGPLWRAPEASGFWKPVVDGLKQRLEKRGLGGSIMWGLASDFRPHKEVVDLLKSLAPEVKWVCHSHPYTDKIAGQPVGYLAYVWGPPPLGYQPPPAKRGFGWKDLPNEKAMLKTTFPRLGSGGADMLMKAPSQKFRFALEAAMCSNLRGLGRNGGEFWSVLKDPKGRLQQVLRYGLDVGETWGMGFDCGVSDMLAPGKDGPIGTVRLECFRENLQEIEARVFIEKTLDNAATRAKLGDELANRCQALLDERYWEMMAAINSPDFLGGVQGSTARAEKLYAAAAEVAAKLGR
jgi:hypothetical protein